MAPNKKTFFCPAFFIAVQYALAFFTIAFFDFRLYKNAEFINNLFFYITIFIAPIILFIIHYYKQNPLIFLEIHTKNIHFGIIAAVFMAVIFLASHKFQFDIQATGINLFAAICGACLAGIFEETVFRGFYLKVFCRKFGFIISNVLVSILFAALHFKKAISGGPMQLVFLFIFSIFIGYLYKETKSLPNAIIIHAAYNTLFVLF